MAVCLLLLCLRRLHLFHRPRPFEDPGLAVGDDASHLQKAIHQVLVEGKSLPFGGFLEQLPASGRFLSRTLLSFLSCT